MVIDRTRYLENTVIANSGGTAEADIPLVVLNAGNSSATGKLGVYLKTTGSTVLKAEWQVSSDGVTWVPDGTMTLQHSPTVNSGLSQYTIIPSKCTRLKIILTNDTGTDITVDFMDIIHSDQQDGWNNGYTDDNTWIDEVSATEIYIGRGPIGASTADPVFHIMKCDGVSTKAASGTRDQVWDDRASLTYT